MKAKSQVIRADATAYGARGFPPVIPPNSTLKFEGKLWFSFHGARALELT